MPGEPSGMFTGIVTAVGVVHGANPAGSMRRITIDPKGWSHRPSPGDSISVDGCCLTLLSDPAPLGGLLTFDAVSETLAKTTLGAWAPGRPVNLEHAATPTSLLGGHLVQGHVDGVARIERIELEGDGPAAPRRFRFVPSPDLMPYLAPKGSVCIDGVSLTIASLTPTSFDVALIPATVTHTTLGARRVGDLCNVEADAIAKQIVHYLRHFAAGESARR